MGMDKKIIKKKWTVKKVIVISVSFIFMSFVIYNLLTIKSNQLNVNKERIVISKVYRGDFQEFIPITGEIIPVETRFLVATEGGRIEKILTQSGTPVKKGDEILRLSNTNLLLDIMYREAELFRQSNNLRNTRLEFEKYSIQLEQQLSDIRFNLIEAENKYKRNKYLYKEKIISKQEFDTSINTYNYYKEKIKLTNESKQKDLKFRMQQISQLENSLKRMNDNLKIVKTKQDELTIKAPIDGLLSLIEIQIGESMNRGQRLGQVDVINSFKVRAQIDQHYIARVEVGRNGSFTYSENDFTLKSTKIYPEVNDNQFKVDFKFTGDRPKGVRRGQTLHIRLELGDLGKALLLDRGGFYQHTGGNWVFVVDESGKKAIKRNLKLGRQNPLFYEVLEGLQPGDKVITSSYDNFGKAEELIIKEK